MTDTTLTLACVQVTSNDDMEANLAQASKFARSAKEAGAELIAFPENVTMMSFGGSRVRANAFLEADHPGLAHFKALAQELDVWLLVGSLHVTVPGEDRVANRSYLISSGGEVIADYDKIHMFDVDLSNGESYRESKTFRPGGKATLGHTPWGGIGMAICYDLRFPHLFRHYAKMGAKILSVPAAFTAKTGQAHWHILLRARAIETGCFVIAPGQCGAHPPGDRYTYGHSLIIDPWGEVLADGGTAPGFVIATLDLAKVDQARGMVPALTHDRDFTPLA